MKQLLLLLALCPLLLWAQDDEKYLAGAVPVENGKVVFSKEIQVPNQSKQQVYDTALAWANERFTGEDMRVAYQNPETGELAAIGEEYIVFSNTVLSLDRSLMSYQVRIYAQERLCRIELTNIRYEYNVSYQRDPERYIAEEWITDKYALRNEKKLNRITGKFRRKTIDFADALFQSAAQAFGQSDKQVQPTPKAEATPAPAPANTTVNESKHNDKPNASQASPEGFTAMDVESIPSTLKQLMPKSTLRIKMADNNITDSSAEWKGFGNMFGKNIASISTDAKGEFSQQVKDGETYTLQFSSDDAVWMIIECSKQGETQEGGRTTIVGEVLHVWVK